MEFMTEVEGGVLSFLRSGIPFSGEGPDGKDLKDFFRERKG
jgi:hypothetical protein